MKKMVALMICFTFLINILPTVSAIGEPQITSYGFISKEGSIITVLADETIIKGYVDIVNSCYINDSNLGELTVECYVNGEVSSTTGVTITIDENTRQKKMVTDDITVPEGNDIKCNVFYLDSEGNKSPVIELNNSLEIPGTENDGIRYSKAIEFVKASGIISGYEDGTFKASQSVSRAEFAAILTRLLKKEASAEAQCGPTAFSDVDGTHWASGCINLVSKLGLMSGYVNGTFVPEGKLTIEQASESFIKVLGYLPTVSAVGFFDKAVDLGIMTDVDLLPNALVSRGALSKLVVNSIDIPLMEQIGFGSSIDYIIQDGSNDTYRKTLMSEKLKIVKLKTVVRKSYDIESVAKEKLICVEVFDSYNSKYDDNNYGEPRFEGELWDINFGITNLKAFVGYIADIYISYNENSVEAPVALYAERYASNQEVTVNFDNIDVITKDYQGVVTVDYYKSYTAITTNNLTIADNAAVYINGYLSQSSVSQVLNDFYGTATFALLDSNTEEDFDTLYVTDYKNLIVDSVNMTTGKVIAKEGTSIIFNPANTDYSSTLVDTEGKKLDWSSLQENDVLSVQRTAGNRIISVCKLVRSSETGAISEVNGYDLYNPFNVEFTINGKLYGVDGQITSAEDFELEDEGTFYIDIMGRIAYFDIMISKNYSYVIAIDTSGTIDSKTQIKMFTYNNEVVTLTTAPIVKVSFYNSGQGYISVSYESKYILSMVTANSFIKYEVNSSGSIYKIELADTSQVSNLDCKNFTKYAQSQTASYDSRIAAFTLDGNRVFATNETVIMVTPVVSEQGYDEENFAIIPLSALSENCYLPNVSVYDVNADKEARCILIQGLDGLNFSSEGLAVFKEESTTEDSYGEMIHTITFVQNGKETTQNTSGDFEWNGSFGDAFIPKRNLQGNINDTKLIASADNVNDKIVPRENMNYDYSYGVVTGKNNGLITTENDEQIIIPATANIYLYDERFGEISIGNIDSFDVSYDDVNGRYIYSSFGEGDIESVSVLTKEYDDIVKDVIFYFFGDLYSLSDSDISLLVTPEAAVSNVVYSNTFDKEISPSLVLARYKNGKLTGFTSNKVSIPKDGSGLFKCSLSGQFENGETVKSILFEDYNNLNPLKIPVSEIVTGADYKNQSDTVTITCDNIISVVGQVVRYYDNALTTKTINLSNSADIYLNGILSESQGTDMLSSFYGEATFSDKDGSNNFNTIHITDYTNTVVGSVNMTTKKVVAKRGISLPFGSMNINTFSVLCDKEGNKLDWSTLKVNDVLSTTVLNKNNVTVYISTLVESAVAGVISEVTTSDSKTEFIINGKKYKVDDQLIFPYDLALNDEGVFYLDIMGRIVYFAPPKTPSNYAYVLDAESSGAIDLKIQIKMCTYMGEIVVLDTSSKVKVSYYDDTQYITDTFDSDMLLDSSKSYYVGSNRFIAYGLNSAGSISSIRFLDVSEEGKSNTNTFTRYAGPSDSTYANDTKSFTIGSKKVYADDSTIIMVAPAVTNSGYGYPIYDEANYRIIPLSMFVDDYELQNVSAYDVNANNVASIILIGSDVDLTSGSNGIALIIKTAATKNSDGDTVDKATVLQNGNKIDLLANPATILDLSLADVIITKYNEKGEITDYTKLAEIVSNGGGVTAVVDNYKGVTNIEEINTSYSKVKLTLDKVKAKASNKITLSNDKDFIIPTSANIYAYNQSGSIAETKVYVSEDGYDIFSIDNSGTIYDADNMELSSVYALIREYDDEVADVIFYLFM